MIVRKKKHSLFVESYEINSSCECNKVVSAILLHLAGEAILCFKPYFQIVGSSKEKDS